MDLEVRQLRVLVAVDEERSFTAAADRLGMSQAAVSRALAALEHELGTRLMHRTTRRVEPTEAGASFTATARRVLAELDRAVAEARGERSVIRVGYQWAALGAHTTPVLRTWNRDARRHAHAARAAEPPRRRPGRGPRGPRGAAASRRPRARLRARRHRAAGRRRADRPSARRPGDRGPRRPDPVHGRPRPAHGHDLRGALDLGGALGAADDRDRRRRGVARPHRRGRRHRRHGGGHRAPLSASGRRVRADRRCAADRGAPRLAPPVPASVRHSRVARAIRAAYGADALA